MAQASDNTQAGALAETYARALFELAVADGAQQDMADELGGLAAVAAADASFGAFLAHRTIAADRKSASLRAILEGRVSSLMLRFILVLNNKGRLGHLAEIAQAYDALLKAARGEVDIEVQTAVPLDGSALTAVADRISAAIGKRAIVTPKTDPSLIGGLKIRIGDRLIDASVASRLRRLRGRLLDAGRNAART